MAVECWMKNCIQRRERGGEHTARSRILVGVEALKGEVGDLDLERWAQSAISGEMRAHQATAGAMLDALRCDELGLEVTGHQRAPASVTGEPLCRH